jgi:hypothetical protein
MYNFMFGPDYEGGCAVCSSIADRFNGVIEHLKARDVTMIAVSRAPIAKLEGDRQRMGWNFFDFEHPVTKETVASWFEGGDIPDDRGGNSKAQVPARLAADCHSRDPLGADLDSVLPAALGNCRQQYRVDR